ncbi:MAG: hypothetical protein AAFN94_00860 [Pseudomonadota bacterium]
MGWSAAALAYLATRAGCHFESAVVISPRNLTSDNIETFTYWTSHHDHSLNLGGTSRVLIPTYGALRMGNPVYGKGTNIRSLDLAMFGLSADAKTLLQGYELRLARVEAYQLLFTPGMEYVGERQRWKGQVNTVRQQIGEKGGTASLEISVTSALRKGTISRAKTKSNASYAERMVDVGNGPEPDTSMEYAGLRDAESDQWG